MQEDDAAELEHIRRWVRPDFERFLRPDWERYVHPAGHEAVRRRIALCKAAFEPWQARRLREMRAEQAREEEAALEAQHQREIEREALDLKAELAALRVELLWAQLNRKAGFNPDQPRDEQGRWTDSGEETVNEDGGPADLGAEGDLPPTDHNDPPSRIPSEKPEESRDRTAAIRAVGRYLGLIAPTAARLSALGTLISGAVWLREYRDEILANLDPPKSLQELHDAVDVPRSGTHRHHIVEQGPAEDDGFPRSMIDARDNLVRIPKQKHQEISDWYSTKSKDFGGETPRDWLRGTSWEERRALGMKKLIELGVLKP